MPAPIPIAAELLSSSDATVRQEVDNEIVLPLSYVILCRAANVVVIVC
jgi:uncharacterized protein (DUF111 family)